MMLPLDPPPVVATAPVSPPPEVVIVSRDAHSDIVASIDTPLPLIKAGRTEDAVFRQAISLTSTLLVVRPAMGVGEEVLRWTYEPHLQRQLCLTSITGQFSCAAAEVEELAEKASGETPLTAGPNQVSPSPNSMAEAARLAVVAALNSRAFDLFEADRRLKLRPMLKAAGVSVRRIPTSAVAIHR